MLLISTSFESVARSGDCDLHKRLRCQRSNRLCSSNATGRNLHDGMSLVTRLPSLNRRHKIRARHRISSLQTQTALNTRALKCFAHGSKSIPRQKNKPKVHIRVEQNGIDIQGKAAFGSVKTTQIKVELLHQAC